MQAAWSGSVGAAGGLPLKRKASASNLLASPQLQAKRPALPIIAAAAQPGLGGGVPAFAVDVDVTAVASKHGWDLAQQNNWSSDRRVRWLPVAAIRRPLQGSRSNGGSRRHPAEAPLR